MKDHSTAPKDVPQARRTVERAALAGFIASMTVLLLAGGFAYRSALGFIDTSGKVTRSHEVLARVEHVLASLQEAVASLRAYIITGDPFFISERDRALSELDSSMQDIKILTRDDAAQQARIADLERRITTRRELLDRMLVARQSSGFEAARNILESAEARTAVSLLRSQLNEVETIERDRLQDYIAENENRARIMLATFAILLVIVAILLAALVVRIRRELRERQAVEDALSRSTAFLDSVVEHIPNMIFIKDARDLRFLRLNRAGEAMIGLSRDQLIGKNDFDFFPAAEAEQFTARDREALAGRKLVDIPEETLQTHGQGKRILHTRKLPICDDEGEPEYLLGISEDITDRKADEEHILRLNADLRRQTEQLAATNKELESFSYSVSHDLRSPLRAIDGFARMLEEDFGDALDKEARRYIGVIRDGSRRMNALIEDLLALSRLGSQPLRHSELDMAALARKAKDEVLAGEVGGADPSAISIQTLPAARGDAVLLSQVWSNLIGNAVKYSLTMAAPAVEISGEANGDDVIYRVKDNGVGFDMRYYGKLFGVFQRLHKADEFPGTGVGLAIVHRIVTRHGGRVWAESTPGAGATFYFSLPGSGIHAKP